MIDLHLELTESNAWFLLLSILITSIESVLISSGVNPLSLARFNHLSTAKSYAYVLIVYGMLPMKPSTQFPLAFLKTPSTPPLPGFPTAQVMMLLKGFLLRVAHVVGQSRLLKEMFYVCDSKILFEVKVPRRILRWGTQKICEQRSQWPSCRINTLGSSVTQYGGGRP